MGVTLFAKVVLAGLLCAAGIAAACSSEPLPKPGTQETDAGAAGAPGASGTPALGGNGGAETAAGHGYLGVENDPHCPDKDSQWSKLGGHICESSTLDRCYKVWDCQPGDVNYVDESLFCIDKKWVWTPLQGPCDASKVKLGVDDCPTTDWSQADGLPCPKEGVACDSHGPSLPECPGGVDYTDYVTCFKRRWRWTFDETDCQCEDCGIGGAGGTGSVSPVGGAGGAAGAPP